LVTFFLFFTRALELLPADSAAHRDVQKKIKSAKLKIKKANRKDYYGLLGVPENADDAVLKKGYRKSALKWHPDRHATKNEEQKAYAEKMFKDCAEAYEVLSDASKRRMYDQGMDLDDIKNGGHGHGHGHGGMGGMGGIDPSVLFQMFGGGMGGMGGGRRGGGGFRFG
jgi:DnaJ family protein C protein 7